MKHFCVQLANPDNKPSSSSMSESIAVDEPGEPARGLPPKPRAAWLLQLFAAICLATSLVGLARLCTLVITDSSNVAMEVALVSAVWRTLAVGVLFLAILGTQRRKNYGRIFGLLLIAVVFGGLLYRQAVGSVEPSTWRLSYTNQQVGETAEALTDLLTLFVIGYWFYAFGLSRRAREFFGPSTDMRTDETVPIQQGKLPRILVVALVVIAGLGGLKLLSLGVSQSAAFASSFLADAKSRKDAEVAMVHAKAAAQLVEAYHRKHSAYPASLTAAEFEVPLPEPVQSIRVNSVTGVVQVVMMGSDSSTRRTFFWEPTLDATGAFAWRCRSDEIPIARLPKECLRGAAGSP